jgi:hypothetical protein
MKESPLFVKLYDFVAWVIPLTMKFPREQRFVVAASLQRETLVAHETAIRAGMAPTPDRVTAHLTDLATHLALIRFYLRLSHQLSCITTANYEQASERLTEVGRLVQGWQRSIAPSPTAISGAAPA